MNSWNNPKPGTGAPRTTILRGGGTAIISPARMDSDLLGSQYTLGHRADARLVDPSLAQAFDEASAIAREQARLEGFEIGYAEGVARAAEEAQQAADVERDRAMLVEQRMQAMVDSSAAVLMRSAEELALRQAANLGDVEDLLLDAAYDLATVLVGRELQSVSEPVRDAIRRALTMVPDDGSVTVFVHPVDLENLAAIEDFAPGRPIRIAADPNVEPGSCTVNVGATHVDASLGAALARVREVLEP
jgi:flagellar assembly protein FliH